MRTRLPFGFCGIGCVNDASLSIGSDMVYPHYARFDATRALISRLFLKDLSLDQFSHEAAIARQELSRCRAMGAQYQQQALQR